MMSSQHADVRCESAADREERHPAPGAAAPDVSSCDTRERFLNGELRRQCRSAHRATVILSSAVRLRGLLNIAAGAAQEVAEC